MEFDEVINEVINEVDNVRAEGFKALTNNISSTTI